MSIHLSEKDFNDFEKIKPIKLSAWSIDLTDLQFGKLTAVAPVDKAYGGRPKWLCSCKCGGTTIAEAGNLRKGHTKSCGCLSKTHGMSRSPEYKAFFVAKDRCENEKNVSYTYYGGKNIRFEFSCFEEFYEEMGDRPSPEHTVDRINPRSHYKVGNVRWATNREQAENKTNTILLTHGGKTMALSRWSRELGIPYSTIYGRLRAGKLTAEALSVSKHKAKLYTFRGKKKTLPAHAKEHSIPYRIVWQRVKEGWSIKQALLTPPYGRKVSVRPIPPYRLVKYLS